MPAPRYSRLTALDSPRRNPRASLGDLVRTRIDSPRWIDGRGCQCLDGPRPGDDARRALDVSSLDMSAEDLELANQFLEALATAAETGDRGRVVPFLAAHGAKYVMLVQSTVALALCGLIVARAVNAFT